ncbi:MAG TPA: hypothetical protein VLA16_01720 [Ideonella sp.]|nr:hypothetical protein [Ideonella sp.]
MAKTAQIVGTVTYREGDGPEILIRPGLCEVDVNELDVTLTWSDGDTHGSTAMPTGDFQRYLTTQAIAWVK